MFENKVNKLGIRGLHKITVNFLFRTDINIKNNHNENNKINLYPYPALCDRKLC